LWDAAVARADAIQQLETGGERDAADWRLCAKSAYACPLRTNSRTRRAQRSSPSSQISCSSQSKCDGVGRSFDRFAKYRVHIRWTIRSSAPLGFRSAIRAECAFLGLSA